MNTKIDLTKFSEVNALRAIDRFNTFKNVPITYWTTAIAGEVGELCNMVKKLERVKHGGIDAGSSYKAADIDKAMLAEEIGGIFIYLDLISTLLEIDLQSAIVATFNDKSEKLGFPERV